MIAAAGLMVWLDGSATLGLLLGGVAAGAGRLDLLGAVTGTAGLVVPVHGIMRSGGSGWSDSLALGSFRAAGLLLAVFLVVQNRSVSPSMFATSWSAWRACTRSARWNPTRRTSSI